MSRMKRPTRPVGLYDPTYEHDACGVAFVARLDGDPTHETVRRAIVALENLEHRGAAGADPNTGDGAGILLQMPDALMRAVLDEDLPPPGAYGVCVCFLPQDEERRAELEALLEQTVADEGQRFVAWRDVPVDKDYVGITANFFAPYIKHMIVAASDELAADQDAFERKLYVIRRVAEIAAGPDLVIPSFSSRTIVYKGMLTSPQLLGYYPDLQDQRTASAMGLVHSRFSTNTFPSWELAHPYRMIAHNGEINTLRGNVNWMRARESQLASELFGDDLPKVLPIVRPAGSDSATFDNVLELLTLAGRSLPHAVMMMIPEAYDGRDDIPEHLRGFYAFHSCLMEPWDGPAAVAFTDGRVIGATLDRNGLRPGRWLETKDGWVVLGSETGVMDEPADNILRKGRLQPGKLFLVDLAEGRIVADEEVKREISTQQPYGEWFERGVVHLGDLPEREPAYGGRAGAVSIRERQLAFGYTQEDLRVLLAPTAAKGEEPIGSMGNDAALAVLSDRQPPLFSYFKQLFAQVTNPPIDPIREAIVMSVGTGVGSERNLLDETPEHARQLSMKTPILRSAELEKLRQVDSSVFRSRTLDITWPVADGADAMEAAVERVCTEASAALADGINVLILSDRALGPERAPIPSLLAVGAVHHHLVREGTRLQTGLVLESGEPREVHHFAVLIGYGASAINPYLMFESLGELVRDGRVADVDDVETAETNVVKGIAKGLLKTISKMGISTIQSYNGAQIFEAVGLGPALIDRAFAGTASRIGGIEIDVLAEETLLKHARAYPRAAEDLLPVGGVYAWRREGEHHMWNPETIALLQHSVRHGGKPTYDEYARLVNEDAAARATLRGLLKFKELPEEEWIPLDQVQPASEIVRRFATGAMSLGSLSREAHETLAIAMNRIGGKSNTGEGGEDVSRYTPDPNGDSRRSAIKQVASGRFGVNINYLVNADELQIKMAQGAKPGEGGQLPGHKVDRYIGSIRFTTPGVGLISPPPHHDIYSIEDLKQLIYDLRCGNPRARISVKLVSEVGVGTVAAGVAKANSDHVLIAGHDGGTGASPLSSIQSAGVPWEIGLAETQQTLVLNDLRSRIWVQTDGQLKTGRDVIVAALLGADEMGFSTAPLIATGCIMMRACHLNTCPVGIATQDPGAAQALQGPARARGGVLLPRRRGGARDHAPARREDVRGHDRARRPAGGRRGDRPLEVARGGPHARPDDAGGPRGDAAAAGAPAGLAATRRAGPQADRGRQGRDRPSPPGRGRVPDPQRQPHRRRAALQRRDRRPRLRRPAAGDDPLHAARLRGPVVRRVARPGRRADADRRRQRLHRQGPLGGRAVRPPARGRRLRGGGERPDREHRALRRHGGPRVLPRAGRRALRGAQLGCRRRRRGRRRPRVRVHDRRARRDPRGDGPQLRGRHERRRGLRARRRRQVRLPLQHGPGRLRRDQRGRRDRTARPDRGAPPAHAVARRCASAARLGRAPAALREGHAARLQARAGRDGGRGTRGGAGRVHVGRGLRRHGARGLMGKLGAFLDITRVEAPERDPGGRTTDYREFVETLPVEALRDQGARCMECGVPFCHNGCPLGNLIPDWNDLVYRDRWREAIDQLHATNNFPEFTGRLCPAPCEAACVLEIREGDAVSIKQIEVAIVNRAFDEGWIVPRPPAVETGRTAAVIGAGPAGLAAAQQLRRAGHAVTVFERDEAGGGLIRFGVPDFKIEKWVVERRLDQLAAEGVDFRYGVDVGVDVDATQLRADFDAVVIATGSRVPRNLPVPGRELEGVHFAMDYLYDRARVLAGATEDGRISAAGKNVLVVGGGDTGADCVGHSHREGAASVTQIELLGEPPASRPDDLTPWPRWPVKLRTSYALKEGGERDFAISTTALTGNGRVEQVQWVQNSGEPPFEAIAGTEESRPVELVLLAMGFLHPEQPLLEALGVDTDGRGNAKAGAYATSADGVFAAGDARRGQSLIVWAINEGRQCARMVDRYLCDLPPRDPSEYMSAGTSMRAGSSELGADPPNKASYGSGHGVTG